MKFSDLSAAERESLGIRDAAWCEARITEDVPIIGEQLYIDRPLRIPPSKTGWIERCTIEFADGGDMSWLGYPSQDFIRGAEAMREACLAVVRPLGASAAPGRPSPVAGPSPRFCAS